MPFQPGNKLWVLRQKDGKDKSLTAQEFLERCNSYFEWIQNNPLKDYDRQTGNEVNRKRPMTIEGLCVYIQILSKTFREWEKGDDHDYCLICSYARDVIESNQLEGAAAGIYVHSIIALKLGLANKHEISGGINVTSINYITPNGPDDQADIQAASELPGAE